MDATLDQMVEGRLSRWTPWRRVALAVLGGALLVSSGMLVFQVSELSSASMSPTLLPGDSVLVNRLIYRFRSPRRGDIVVLHFPQAAGRDFVKRVIGVAGDVVGEEAGRFTVNGMVVHESRADLSNGVQAVRADLAPRRVPPEQVYVLGDNWRTSLDSRFWGTVDEQKVVGEAVLICWSRGAHWWNVHWSRLGRWLE
jgi:signal peptidase I